MRNYKPINYKGKELQLYSPKELFGKKTWSVDIPEYIANVGVSWKTDSTTIYAPTLPLLRKRLAHIEKTGIDIADPYFGEPFGHPERIGHCFGK